MNSLIPPKRLIASFESNSQEEIEAFNNMLQDPKWMNATAFREQCKVLIDYMQNDTIHFSFSKLGLLFGSSHCVQKQYYKLQKDCINLIGRPKLLNDSQYMELMNAINTWHSKSFHTSYDEIAEFVLFN